MFKNPGLKNLLAIVTFVCVLQIIISQSNPLSTPSTGVHTLPVVNCGSNPTAVTDCTKNNITEEYCCYLTPKASGASQCVKISPQNYRTTMTSYLINNIDYKIDCNITPGSITTPCGGINAKTSTECWNTSVANNNCCFYKSDILIHCVWMGPVTGQITPMLACPSSSTTTSIQGQFGTLCSLQTPKSSAECFALSTSTNSCCFTANAGTNVCIWNGSKYDGKMPKEGFTCSTISSFLNINFIILALFILTFLF